MQAQVLAPAAPKMASMTAIIIGGTGATGNSLLRTLIQAKDKVSKVILLSRRAVVSLNGVDLPSEERNARLIQHVEDLETVSDDKVKEMCTGGNVFFNCMGTSIPLLLFGTPSAYRKVAYDIPVRLTRLAHQAGVPHCSVLTAVTSDPNSWSLYVRSKGQLEAAGQELFPHTSAFRAGPLDRGDETRFIERFGLFFVNGLPVSTLAEAMFLDAWDYHTKQQSTATSEGEGATGGDSNTISVFYNDDIRQICRRNRLLQQNSQ